MSKTSPANRALSKLRIARGCLIGLELAVADAAKRTTIRTIRQDLAAARTFARRAQEKIADAQGAMVAAFAAANVPFSIRPRKGKAPADRVGASSRAK
ncbi:MAG TPA: hypothetical protein VMY35_10415 [Phycisphaerae bacterium]|nr:hypothetical protein [Phycisphaerae bacterium]